ncbi:MAG TPA: class I adenylate-forming enzyme family protein [Xanthobacteraceae bacterium]|jgi:acyl-coenzyme A synthetase/AMP-(fatty) acid ligase
MAGGETALREQVTAAPDRRCLWDREKSIRLTDLRDGSVLGTGLPSLAGRSVLLAVESQLSAALALIELDGVARRIVILPPGVEIAHLAAIAAATQADAAVVDDGSPPLAVIGHPAQVRCHSSIVPMTESAANRLRTEWVLVTSGTTGVPKMVVHNLASLAAPLHAQSPADGAAVWGTFYDIRRYGGMQIYLRALLGGASFVLSDSEESVSDHLARLAAHDVTHLSGTPSHWRRALMNPDLGKISPRYVRLSGEIADQAVLDGLRTAFPRAVIGHAYASTEAGVAFDVNDGRAGFPPDFLAATRDGVEMKIADGSLRIRSPRTASAYLGAAPPLAGADGFVDTGDIVEQDGNRCYFAGRKGGIINIGGMKVHPEEVEAVINRHPRVRMSLVRGRQSPITGSVVVAEVVLSPGQELERGRQIEVKNDILKFCSNILPRHKVPAAISFVPKLEVAATGKLVRRQG